MIRGGTHHLGQPCSRPLSTPQHGREAGPLHPPAPHRSGLPPRPARLDGWGNPKTAVASERHGPATLALPAPSGPAPTMAAARLCGGCCEGAAPAPLPAGAGRLCPVSRTTPPATPPSCWWLPDWLLATAGVRCDSPGRLPRPGPPPRPARLGRLEQLCESAAPAPPPAGAGRLYPVSRTTPPATPPSSYARWPPSVASIPPAQSDHFSVVTRMPAATDTVLYREQPASGLVCPNGQSGRHGVSSRSLTAMVKWTA